MPHGKKRRLAPIHPGEALREILNEAGLSANALALALRIPANRITKILRAERGITADTAMRLARYFGTSAEMWMNLQAKYELDAAEDAFRERVEREVLPRAAA
jgi:addiction module HigA family antidote